MGTLQLMAVLSMLVSHLLMSSVTATTTPAEYEARIEQLESVSKQLARQLMLQQFYVEEKTRSEGDSGLKQIRFKGDGTKPYYTATHAGKSMASMHDHSDLIATSGLGEMIVVLNGLEFRTRHNDYKLKMPSTTSGDYHATEDIPFPEVPPAVFNQSSIDMQIIEMRQWFRAWRDSNSTIRDYRKYFRPLLCYIEGAWTTDVTKVEEPFDSDRHQIAADSWLELLEQVRFTSYLGDKNNLENFAYLPTTIMNVTEDGVPIFGQWNYRILCHRIQDIDLKLSDLKPVDNLPNRLLTSKTYEGYKDSRGARFTINPYDSDRSYKWDLLDRIMKQIPGKNNYGANITDAVYDLKKMDVFDDSVLNTGYYHRWFKVQQAGAMGEKYTHRGFADRNLFVAETTQPRVAPSSYQHCKFPKSPRRRTCIDIQKRVSYAVPLEIVWLTPLSSWNPFDIEYKGDSKSELAKTVTKGVNGTRNGGKTKRKAYDGIHSKLYYLTPAQFYSGGEVEPDKADTTRGSVGVLNRQKNLTMVKSAGIRIFLPNIPGVGVLRTRYPIMPVYAEGSSIWKELEALRDIVMNMGKYTKYFEVPPSFSTSDQNGPATKATVEPVHTILHTSMSKPGGTWGLHKHTITLVKNDFVRLTKRQKILDFITSEDNGHVHSVSIDYNEKNKTFKIVKCDGKATCYDGHSSLLTAEV